MNKKFTIIISIVMLLSSGCASVEYSAVVEKNSAIDLDGSGKNDKGYYLNDGPASSSAQIALADIPDATVRYENINLSHNRPYVVLGKRYVPFTALTTYHKSGIASWYGKRYHGRQTASGEKYDMHKMTAAHPILPIPSYVRVTSVSTGESVVVRINDRGPFLQGREIDLSYVAAAKLGIVHAGTGEVTVELIIPSDAPTTTDNSGGTVEQVQVIDEKVYIQLAAFAYRSAADEHSRLIAGRLPPEFSRQLSVYQKRTDLYALQFGPYNHHEDALADDNYLCQQYELCGFLTKRY